MKKLLIAGHVQSCAICSGACLVRRRTRRRVACHTCRLFLEAGSPAPKFNAKASAGFPAKRDRS